MFIIVMLSVVSLGLANAETHSVQEGPILNTRSGPGTNYAIVKRLAPGTDPTEVERQGIWSRLELPSGQETWVHFGFLWVSLNGAREVNSKQHLVNVLPRLGHTSSGYSVAFSRDGRQVLTVRYDAMARLLGAETVRELSKTQLGFGSPGSIAFCPDGPFILTVDIDSEAPARTLDVTEIASYIDRRLPEYSEAAFGYTQVPQMKVVGNSFPIARATVVLSDEPSEIIPKIPTHVVIQAADVFAEAVEGGAVVMKLQPGTSVRLMSSDNGWVFIAKDGEEIGHLKN